jgi:hypothetical protein
VAGWESVQQRAQPEFPRRERSGLSKRRPARGCAPSRAALPLRNGLPLRAAREGAPDFYPEALREDGCKLSRDGDRDSEREARSDINRLLTLLLRVRPVDGLQPLPPKSANSRVRQRAPGFLADSNQSARPAAFQRPHRKDLTLTGQPLHSRSLRLRASVFLIGATGRALTSRKR